MTIEPNSAVLAIWAAIALMSVLTLIGVFRLAQAAMILRQEHAALRMISDALRRIPAGDETPRHLAMMAAFRQALQTDSKDFNALDKRSVYRFVKQQVAIAQTEMFRDYAVRDLDLGVCDALLRGVRFLAGILVFLALLGTVTGLGIALNSLPKMDASNQSFEAFNGIVRHMPLAFLSTMTGIFGTILLNWLMHECQKSRRKLQNDLDTLMFDVMLPAFAAVPEQNLLNALTKTNALLEGLARVYLEPLRDDSKEFRLNVTSVIGKLNTNADQLTVLVRNVKQEAEAASRSVVQSAEETTATLKQETASLLTKIEQETRQSAGRLETIAKETAERLEITAGQTQRDLQTTARTASEQIVGMTRSTTHSLAVLGEQAVRTAEATLSASETIHQESIAVIAALTQSGDSLRQTLAQIGDAIAAVPGILDATRANQQQYHETLDALNTTQNEIRTDLGKVIENWVGVGAQLRAMEDHLNRIVTDAITQNQQTATQASAAHKQFLEALSVLSAQLSEQMQQLTVRERSLYDALNRRISLVVGSETGEGPTMAERIATALHALEAQLKEMTARLANQTERMIVQERRMFPVSPDDETPMQPLIELDEDDVLGNPPREAEDAPTPAESIGEAAQAVPEESERKAR